MTFNEGMQIDTSTTSSSGGGRGPGRGMAIGGGFGGLIIVVVALFLGVDPGSVIPQDQGHMRPGVEAPGFDLSQCRTGKDANDIVQCRVVATGNSVDAVWEQLMRGYTRPRVELFNGSVRHRLRPGHQRRRAVLLPGRPDGVLRHRLLRGAGNQFGSSGGPFAQEYVVAHEFGHHVQNLQGTLGRRSSGCRRAPRAAGVRTELQADCYAGVWAHYAAITKQEGTDVPFLEPLSDKDIADALSAASAVGDDRIQKEATGRVNPESWTHGSSEQRQKWFTIGYQTGDPNKCDTFATRDLG